MKRIDGTLPKRLRHIRVGVALAGGGARGAAHIGTLKALTEAGIQPARVAGSSAGAITGAMYAASLDPDWMEQRFREFLDSDVFQRMGTDRLAENQPSDSVWHQVTRKIRNHVVLNVSLVKSYVLEKSLLEDAIRFLLPVERFEDLELPLEVMATDIQSGQDAIYAKGDLIEALVQSGSIPGFMEPTIDRDRIVVDGGVTVPVPIRRLLNQCDFTVAVDISRAIDRVPPTMNMYEMMLRAERVKAVRYALDQVSLADFVLSPNVGNLHWSAFDKFDALVTSGHDHTSRRIPDMMYALEQHRRRNRRWVRWLGLAGS